MKRKRHLRIVIMEIPDYIPNIQNEYISSRERMEISVASQKY